MIRSIDDFKVEWLEETKSTTKVFEYLTNESLATKVTTEGRSLGFLAWHIVLSLGEMPSSAGLGVTGPKESDPIPTDSAEILKAYKQVSDYLLQAVSDNWTDRMLDEEIELYGEKWKRGSVLSGLIKHEIHHRAQMTVLMRQAGLKVPGVYGPSREEWVAYGMPEQK
jgi:uncharacterized damage-inducible protein DinB